MDPADRRGTVPAEIDTHESKRPRELRNLRSPQLERGSKRTDEKNCRRVLRAVLSVCEDHVPGPLLEPYSRHRRNGDVYGA